MHFQVHGKPHCHEFVQRIWPRFWEALRTPLGERLRAIIPMSSILRLMDRILGNALDRNLSTLLPARPGFVEGGRPKTQALDICHAATLLIEKALDMKSEGAVAQVDIQTYFDALPVYEM